jgi:hypothetical protein
MYGMNREANTQHVIVQISDGTPGNFYYVIGGTITAGKWTYVSGTYDGTTLRLYVDGVQVGTTASTINIGTTNVPLDIGYNSGYLQEAFEGALDEARISNAVRSADWISTEYYNQSAPNTFYSYSAEGIQQRSSATAGVQIRGGTGAATDWYNTSWLYRKKITINPQYVGGGESNFPLIVSRTDPDFKYSGSGGHFASSTAGEIVFTDSSGNKLSHEIEYYASTTGQIIAWVKVPFLSSTSTRDIYVYYGNTTVPLANQQDKTNVWDSNYKAVVHLPDGSSLTANDSTSNGNNGTISGATADTGYIDGNALFDGVNNSIDIGAIPQTGTLTLSAWVKATAVPPGGDDGNIITESGFADGTAGYQITTTKDNGPYQFDILIMDNSLANNIRYSNTQVVLGQWYYVVGTFNPSTTQNIYINGQLDNGSTAGTVPSNNMHSSTHHTTIGYDSAYPLAFKGDIDEVRISNVARSSDWITTEYNNQASPGTFVSFSGEGTRTQSTGGVKFR